MRKLYLVACIIISTVILQACSTSYERNSTPGEVKQITLAEMETMIEQKETFAIMLSQTYCGFCQDFEVLLDDYIKDHHVVMYNVVLDQEERSESENLDIIKQYFEGFYSTPGIFYVEEGKAKAQLEGNRDGITKKRLDDWVVKNQIDK